MIVVTGASGLLGAAVVRGAVARGGAVTAVGNRHPVHGQGISVVRLDLQQPAAAEQLVRECQPSVIVHCAAITDVNWCEDHRDEAFAANVEVPRRLASAAAARGTSVVYISTDGVFSGPGAPFREADPAVPLNVYAESKLRGEDAVLAAGGRTLVVRSNIFGSRPQPPASLADWLLHKLQRREPVPGFTDVMFNPLYVGDLADVLLDLIAQQATGVYHAGAADACSKFTFAQQLAEQFGFDPGLVQPVKSTEMPMRAPRPMNTVLDTTRLDRALGRSLPTMASAIERFRNELIAVETRG